MRANTDKFVAVVDNSKAGADLVSVLIPLYNKAEWIETTIRSALAQTHKNLEVIVIDDGSRDGSAEVVYGIDDARLFLKTRENRGANATRNELLELAHGNYIQYLDADDLLVPRKIELQLLGLKEGFDVSLCPVWKETEGGWLQPETSDLGSAEAVVRHGIHTLAPLHHVASLRAVGGWSTGLPASQEYDLHLRLLSHGHWERPHQVSEPLGVWRRVENSTSGDDGRVYSAKVKALTNAAATAPPALRAEIARALANAARHLARSRDFAGADDSLASARSMDVSALNEYPRRIRWVPNNRAMNRLEWLDARLPWPGRRASRRSTI